MPNGKSEHFLEEKESKLQSKTNLELNGTHISETTQPQTCMGVSTGIKTISTLLYVIFKLETILYVPFFIYRVFEKSEKVPPLTDDVLRLSASQLSEKIRNQEILCEDVIRRYIARIKQVNPIINAVIEDRFGLALEEAKRVDQMVKKLRDEDLQKWEGLRKEYPLLGVPLTVKGSLDLKGLKNSSGNVTRTEICQKNSMVVDMARKAGAIPMLTSNVPELCMNWETSNKVIGTTNNPHNTSRTSGGSSGGEASLLSSGASLIGIGSDVAGSLRLPAHYCGVFGHKPTPNVVPVEGHYPSCQNLDRWNKIFSVGPMARYAQDLKTLLKVLCKEEFKDKLKLEDKVNLKSLKIFYIEDLNSLLSDKVNRQCSEHLEKAVKHMSKVCKVTAQKIDLPLLRHAPYLASSTLLTIEGVDTLFRGDQCDGTYSELLKYITGRSNHTFMPIFFGLVKKLHNRIPEAKKTEANKRLQDLKTILATTLGQNGVLLVPCYPSEAPPHKDSLRKPFNSGFCSLFNAIGFPATCCPLGKTLNGLPVGIQIAALPFNDNLTLEVARELEKEFGGWIKP